MRAVIKQTGSSEVPLVADREARSVATMPAGFAAYELNNLLAGITQDNMHAEVTHAEVGFGLPVGAEAI